MHWRKTLAPVIAAESLVLGLFAVFWPGIVAAGLILLCLALFGLVDLTW